MLTDQMRTVQVVNQPASTISFSGAPGTAMTREFPAYVKASLQGTYVQKKAADPETAVGLCIEAAAADASLGLELPSGFRELALEELGRLAIQGEVPNVRVEQV
jgi:hypothetical protein